MRFEYSLLLLPSRLPCPQLSGSVSGAPLRVCGSSEPSSGWRRVLCFLFFLTPSTACFSIGIKSLEEKLGAVEIRINHKLFIDRSVTPETASVFQPSPIATTAACPMNSS